MFTKRKHLIPIEDIDATTNADAVSKSVIKAHDLFEAQVRDRGSHFLNAFYGHLCERSGVKRRHSTNAHPQTDFQPENTNTCKMTFAVANHCRTRHHQCKERNDRHISLLHGHGSPFEDEFRPSHGNIRERPEPCSRFTRIRCIIFATDMERLHELCAANYISSHVRYSKASMRRTAKQNKEGEIVWLDRRNIRYSDKSDLRGDWKLNLSPRSITEARYLYLICYPLSALLGNLELCRF